MQTIDEQKQAKNVEQAKQARWMGLLLSALGAVIVWGTTHPWHDAPNVSSALDLYGAPPGFFLFLGASTLLIIACLLVLLYLRKASPRWEKQFNGLKETDYWFMKAL